MPKPERDIEYLRWIKSLPCLICYELQRGMDFPEPPAGKFDPNLSVITKDRYLVPIVQASPTEAHHHGPRGYSQKVPDRQAIPLCVEHHRTGRDSVHQLGHRFAEQHGIDVEAEIKRLNAKYDKELWPA